MSFLPKFSVVAVNERLSELAKRGLTSTPHSNGPRNRDSLDPFHFHRDFTCRRSTPKARFSSTKEEGLLLVHRAAKSDLLVDS